MATKEALPLESINSKPYQTQTNYTAELARLSSEYARLHDQWQNMVSTARRLREDADEKERRAIEVQKLMDKVSSELLEHIGKASQ